MAVIFMDGFDWYTTADMSKRWTSAGLSTISAAYARGLVGQGMQSGTSNDPSVKSFSSNYAQGVFGFALNLVSTGAKQLFTIRDGATEQCSIRTNASTVLTVTQNGTVRATGTTVLSSATWYYVELKATVSSSGVAELKLNGASEIASTSSIDLTGTANNYWNQLAFATTAHWFDDFYVLDPTTGSNTDFLGPVQISARIPTGNGNASSWTPNGGSNMGCVSELFEDGNASFVQSSTANQIDTYTMQDLPAAAGSVFALAQHTVAVQDGGGTRTIAPVYRIGSTDYVGTSVNTSASYQFLTEIKDASPATASAWTVSEVNGLESGFKLIA